MILGDAGSGRSWQRALYSSGKLSRCTVCSSWSLLVCSSDAVNSPSVLSAALRFLKNGLSKTQCAGIWCTSWICLLQLGERACLLLEHVWRVTLFWNGCVVGVNISRPVVWGATKPHWVFPPYVRGGEIVRVKPSGENICRVLPILCTGTTEMVQCIPTSP
jgi:hypothetical protein